MMTGGATASLREALATIYRQLARQLMTSLNFPFPKNPKNKETNFTEALI